MVSNFTKYDLGQLKRGAVVVVTLRGSAANVRLMDASNLAAFSRGARHSFHGGFVTRSPHRIVVPRDGRWYVTVDLMGLRSGSRVQSSVRVEPAVLPAARTARPASLSSVRVEPPQPSPTNDNQVWDVFISHAGEDKADVARPLYAALTDLGLSVWFDEAELKIGDSLRRNIDRGLARSAFGVVVCSSAFFSKGWPQYELDGIVTRTNAGEQTLLPIWHRMTRDEVRAQSPSLADKVARSTSAYSVAEIAREIAERVRPELVAAAEVLPE